MNETSKNFNHRDGRSVINRIIIILIRTISLDSWNHVWWWCMMNTTSCQRERKADYLMEFELFQTWIVTKLLSWTIFFPEFRRHWHCRYVSIHVISGSITDDNKQQTTNGTYQSYSIDSSRPANATSWVFSECAIEQLNNVQLNEQDKIIIRHSSFVMSVSPFIDFIIQKEQLHDYMIIVWWSWSKQEWQLQQFEFVNIRQKGLWEWLIDGKKVVFEIQFDIEIEIEIVLCVVHDVHHDTWELSLCNIIDHNWFNVKNDWRTMPFHGRPWSSWRRWCL